MPKRKDYAAQAEEVQDLQRRAQEKRNKAAYSETMAILRKFPHAAESALTHLQGLGFHMDAVQAQAPKSRQAQSVEDRVLSKKASSESLHPSLPDHCKAMSADVLVPTRFDTLDALTVPLLQAHCLTAVEPTTLSASNLRSMTLSGKIDSTKQEFLRLTEYASGQDKAMHIVGNLRVWSAFKEFMQTQSIWRGRRCNDLRLPVDWPNEGVYSHVEVKGKLCIQIRRTEVKKAIPTNKLPLSFSMGDVRIHYNWSETKAAVYFASGSDEVPFKVAELFPTEEDHILELYKSDYAAFPKGESLKHPRHSHPRHRRRVQAFGESA